MLRIRPYFEKSAHFPNLSAPIPWLLKLGKALVAIAISDLYVEAVIG
jgi:hypothetical protein